MLSASEPEKETVTIRFQTIMYSESEPCIGNSGFFPQIRESENTKVIVRPRSQFLFPVGAAIPAIKLVETVCRTHGGLDVDRLDVLPVLLEKGHEEVNGQVDVL